MQRNVCWVWNKVFCCLLNWFSGVAHKLHVVVIVPQVAGFLRKLRKTATLYCNVIKFHNQSASLTDKDMEGTRVANCSFWVHLRSPRRGSNKVFLFFCSIFLFFLLLYFLLLQEVDQFVCFVLFFNTTVNRSRWTLLDTRWWHQANVGRN